MLKSMTGFGRSEQLIDGYLVKVQMKSVNHRYSDFTIKTPRYYAFLEDKIRNAAMKSISRGKVEILVSIEQKEDDDREITLNRPVAEGYIKALHELSELGVRDDLSVSAMSRLNDIFDVEYKEIDEEKITAMVLEVFSAALADFVAMRIDEGKRLGDSLNQHLESLLSEAEIIEKRSPECVSEYMNRLRKKLEDILADRSVDETRIITEAAIFADKISVDEELVRLRSHVTAFKKTMQADEPVGKKLDFIVQEMNREANTTGSKCNDADVASHVVELKSIIEKIREQIQNIE
ncbi:MAG: YicC/YloC family endoribonuclease [Clostridia bacterium]|nr:YicC/YloC family endoribonuclease [Clostridia bacterium]